MAECKNFIFRKIGLSDIETIRQWRMSPDVNKYLLSDVNITVDDQIAWYNRIRNDNRYMYWIIQYDGIDIGFMNLSDIDFTHQRADPGIYICNSKFRGLGLFKHIMYSLQWYCFRHLNLNKLYGPVIAENYAALVAYMKSGFTVEGYQKNHIYKHGKYMDIVMIGMLGSGFRYDCSMIIGSFIE